MFNLRANSIDPEKFKERQEENEKFVFLKSKFNFINDHNGFRPGCMHVILSTTGGGKSTLAMTLIDEILQADKRILVYSSEETTKDFETKMSYVAINGHENRLKLFHENTMLGLLNRDINNVEAFLYEIEKAMTETQPEIFIFDNVTTSLFYDQNKRANEVAMGLKSLCEEWNIPFLIVAHTTASVRQNEFFDSSKIRGFRSIVNTAQYVYCLMRFKVQCCGYDQEITTIFTDKSRNHPVASRQFYKIFYEGKNRLFSGDEKIKYEAFKGLLKGEG